MRVSATAITSRPRPVRACCARLGAISLQTLTYGKRIDHFGVRLSLHPAGHVLGSAQVRLEHAGRVWVASGDYFVSGAGDDNTTCAPFEPQRCDCFITESTFGLPIYRWQPQRALGEHTGLDPKLVAQRMMGYTDAKRAPDVARYTALLAPPEHGAAREAGEPYPFFLAHPIEGKHDSFEARFGAPGEWLVEWKYDGIRAQLVKRAGRVWLWSRGEELMTERFPEVEHMALALPDGTVLDGELLVWKNERPAPFALLQQRIGRKSLGKKLLADAPAQFVAYDLLEWAGDDVRHEPQRQRRARLARARRGGLHAQAPGVRIRHRANQGRRDLVEVEARAGEIGRAHV